MIVYRGNRYEGNGWREGVIGGGIFWREVVKYSIRKQLVAQLRTLPTYISRSYDQGIHNALNEVSVPADKPRQQERNNYPFLDPSCQHTRTAPMCPTPHG